MLSFENCIIVESANSLARFYLRIVYNLCKRTAATKGIQN